MKTVLLVGCGAEIGSLLVGMVEPERDGLEIGAILTNPIAGDPKHPHLTGVDSLLARVVLAQPHLYGRVGVDRERDALIIDGRSVPVVWGDARTQDLSALPRGSFDAAIIATSKTHINDPAVTHRFLDVAGVVVGVAEATSLPGLYPCLAGAPLSHVARAFEPVGGHRVFCLGSCQTNGWQAQLRAVLEMVDRAGLSDFRMRGMEVDIVHPDTPTGRLGTKSLSARQQDPRNNLRPSFSQVEMSMGRLYPGTHSVNTISLRTLTQPPGYQISRFFFSYGSAGGGRLDRERIAASFAETAAAHPLILHMPEQPLGSRGFEFCEAAAVVLPQPCYLRFADDPFGAATGGNPPVSELIVQAYVHNTRGYCRSVIEGLRHLLYDPAPRIVPPEGR